MRRTLTIAFGTIAALVSGACDDGGYYDNRSGYGGYYDPCAQFTSCGGCTPIIGCGWCSYGNGQGVCLSEPNECRTSQFTWTWDPPGCSTSNGPNADAGVVGNADAEAGASTSDDANDAPAE